MLDTKLDLKLNINQSALFPKAQANEVGNIGILVLWKDREKL